MTWGGDGFSARQIDQYQLAPFLAEIPAELMAVGERNSVLPAYRGTGVLDADARVQRRVHRHRTTCGWCSAVASRTCCRCTSRWASDRTPPHNINSPAAGYLIPLVSFVPDVEALARGRTVDPAGELPGCIEAVLARSGSVRSEALTEFDDYWSEIRRTLDELDAQRISAFDGFTDDEAQRCIARSNIIECAAGDRVLKRGGTARNIFVVLDGTLEVRDDDRIVNVLSAGDAFGEMAFLLERPRSFDVDAATDGTRILSLSEGALRKMIAEDATVAAKLLLNLSKMLCVRLIRAS